MRPFLARPDRGALLLCRTSNPGAKDFQDLAVEGLPLYRRVAQRAPRDWNEHGNLMFVVGATYPGEMARLAPSASRAVRSWCPGIGAQGGDLAGAARRGLGCPGAGLLISSSRSIIYAGGGAPMQSAQPAAELHSEINSGAQNALLTTPPSTRSAAPLVAADSGLARSHQRRHFFRRGESLEQARSGRAVLKNSSSTVFALLPDLAAASPRRTLPRRASVWARAYAVDGNAAAGGGLGQASRPASSPPWSCRSGSFLQGYAARFRWRWR